MIAYLTRCLLLLALLALLWPWWRRHARESHSWINRIALALLAVSVAALLWRIWPS